MIKKIASQIAELFCRYIAICAPFFRMKYNIKAIVYMTPILIFVPIYNLPRFFEFKSYENVTYICTDELEDNYTGHDLQNSKLVIDEMEYLRRHENEGLMHCDNWHKKTLLVLDVTETRKDEVYVTVRDPTSSIIHSQIRNVSFLIVFVSIKKPIVIKSGHNISDSLQMYVNFVNYAVNLAFPILTLCILNFFIYQSLRKNLTPEVRRNQNQQAENALRKRDIRLTRISIVIVVIFIVCHVPRFIPNISELIFGKLTKPFQALISLNNLLQIISSTVNYVIYFGSCWQFKKSEKSSQSDRMRQQMEMRPLANSTKPQTEAEQQFVEVMNCPQDGITIAPASISPVRVKNNRLRLNLSQQQSQV